MKKELKILMMILTISLMIVGCSKKDSYCDKDFLKAMAQGLDARWNIQDVQFETGSEEHYNQYTKYVDAELSKVKKYKDEKFKDSKLQELAIQYINQLKEQKRALKYLTTDYDKYGKIWEKAYNERSKLIVEINKKYKLDVSEKNKKMLQEMKVNSEKVISEEEMKKTLEDTFAKAKMKKVSDDYGWCEYKTIVNNKTKTKFKDFSVNVKLLNKNGVVVETLYDSTQNWEPNSKVQFTFSTDKKFNKYKFEYSYYIEE